MSTFDDDESLGSMMFGPKMGTWEVHSNLDPRWNKSGRAKGLCCSGDPQEMRDWIAHCKMFRDNLCWFGGNCYYGSEFEPR